MIWWKCNVTEIQIAAIGRASSGIPTCHAYIVPGFFQVQNGPDVMVPSVSGQNFKAKGFDGFRWDMKLAHPAAVYDTPESPMLRAWREWIFLTVALLVLRTIKWPIDCVVSTETPFRM